MPTKQYALIARESRGVLAVVVLCALLLQVVLGFEAAAAAWIALLVLIYIFRDPTESPPSLPLAIVSPVHGRILHVAETWDPWLKRNAECIAAESGVFDVGSIYAPTEGKIMEQWSEVPDPAPDEVSPPHSSAYWIRTDEDDDIVLVIHRGPWGGRISLGYHPGERVGQGRRIGYANFGSRTTLYLPKASRCDVSAGDRVAAGSAVIATLVHLTRMAQPRDDESQESPDGAGTAS